MSGFDFSKVIVRKVANDRFCVEFPEDVSENFPNVEDNGLVHPSYMAVILARVANAMVDAEGCVGNVYCKDCWF